MQSQRFPEFGELPLYAERLRLLGVQFLAVLLSIALAQAGTLLFVRTDAPAQVREGLRSGGRLVLALALGPPRVGLQIGHDGAAQQPDELLHLRGNTGGHAGSLSELNVNRSVAKALAARLRAEGVVVDILSATPPASYHADLMLALHADSVWDSARSGYKSATFDPPRSGLEADLKTTVDKAYRQATGLADDTLNTTSNMRGYYAFNFRRYRHSVHPATPALIVELGYLSNPGDAALLRQPQRLADALASGVVPFLQSRNRLP